MLASDKGQTEVVKVLIAAGADIRIKNKVRVHLTGQRQNGISKLYLCASFDIVSVLLSNAIRLLCSTAIRRRSWPPEAVTLAWRSC
jgi:hypothetical protein